MGLLTPDQRAAMVAGNAAYRQIWSVQAPHAAGSSTFVSRVLHDDDAGTQRMVNAGQRETEAYNQSLAHPGRLPSGMYAFTVANDDGLLYTTTPENFWYAVAGLFGYQAQPVECRIEHRVYVRLLDGTWSELEMLRFVGRVADVDYNDNQRTVTITAEALIREVLRLEWSETDGNLLEPVGADTNRIQIRGQSIGTM